MSPRATAPSDVYTPLPHGDGSLPRRVLAGWTRARPPHMIIWALIGVSCAIAAAILTSKLVRIVLASDRQQYCTVSPSLSCSSRERLYGSQQQYN